MLINITVPHFRSVILEIVPYVLVNVVPKTGKRQCSLGVKHNKRLEGLEKGYPALERTWTLKSVHRESL